MPIGKIAFIFTTNRNVIIITRREIDIDSDRMQHVHRRNLQQVVIMQKWKKSLIIYGKRNVVGSFGVQDEYRDVEILFDVVLDLQFDIRRVPLD